MNISKTQWDPSTEGVVLTYSGPPARPLAGHAAKNIMNTTEKESLYYICDGVSD